METRTIVYECILGLSSKTRHWWGTLENFDPGDVQRARFGLVADDYPLGTRLTVTVTIEAPDAAKLDDDAAGKLNTFMNGGA